MEKWELELENDAYRGSLLEERVRAFLNECKEVDTETFRTISNDGRSSLWDDDDYGYSGYATSDQSEYGWDLDEDEDLFDEYGNMEETKSSEDFAAIFVNSRDQETLVRQRQKELELQSSFSLMAELEKSVRTMLATQFPLLCCLSASTKDVFSFDSSRNRQQETYEEHMRRNYDRSPSSSSDRSQRRDQSAFQAWLAARSLLQYADSLESVGVRRVADLIYLSDEDLDALSIDDADRVHFCIEVVG